MGRDHRRIARPHRRPAAAHARGTAPRDLPGDLYTDATCRSCGACAQPRDAVIAFPAHGAWRLAEKATAARDVPVGESWAFREHRSMAEVIAEEKTTTA